MKGAHAPIIAEDVFWQVQEQRTNRRRAMKDQTIQIFAGLLKCADCGKHMAVSSIKAKSTYRYYDCNQYRMYGNITGACSSHMICYDVLYQHVLSRLQYWTKQAQTNEKELLEKLLHTSSKEQQAVIKKHDAELAKAEKRRKELDHRFAMIYEDRIDGRITEHNFGRLSQKYQAEQQELDKRIAKLQSEQTEEKQVVSDTEKWVKLIKQYAVPTKLNAELLNTLIQKILILKPVKLGHKLREQEIEIFYRFVGKID